MKEEEKITQEIIDGAIRRSRPGRVTIEGKGLFESLSHRQGLRMFLLVASLLLMLVLTVYYSVAYIKDVILFESDVHINQQGTFNPHKPLHCEYYQFVFNTSEVWANPGIQINEGDKMRICISGGFNSSVADVLDATRRNTDSLYKWESYSSSLPEIQEEDRWSLAYCLAQGKEDCAFGTILYTVMPESADIVKHPYNVPVDKIQRWDPGKLTRTYDKGRAFRACKQSGYLYFAVNDLLFDDNMESYYEELRKRGVSEEKIRTERTGVEQDPFFLYKDNLGQLLVSVEIQRHVPNAWIKPLMAFRSFMYDVSEVLDDNDRGTVVQILLVCWYFLRFAGNITLIFLIWLAAILLISAALYYPARGLFRLQERRRER